MSIGSYPTLPAPMQVPQTEGGSSQLLWSPRKPTNNDVDVECMYEMFHQLTHFKEQKKETKREEEMILSRPDLMGKI